MKITAFCFSFLLSLAILCPAYAKVHSPPRNSGPEYGWMHNGRPVADTENVKSKNSFGAQLWVIDDARFFDDWNSPGVPRIPVTRTAVRNEPVYIIILFINPGLDRKAQADVTADITIRSPDGSVYGAFHGIEVWQRQYSAPRNAIQLGLGNLSVEIEDDDQLGTYTVEATIRDKKKKVSLTLKTSFLAVASQGMEI